VKRLGLILCVISIALTPVSAISAQKITPGSTCKVSSQKTVYQNKTYTCIKSGKKLVWNTGIAVVKTTPTPTQLPAPTPTPTQLPAPTPTPTPEPPKAGDSCSKLSTTVTLASGLLMCKYAQSMTLKYFLATGTNLPIFNPTSPDRFSTCQIKDQRATKLNNESIAFPVAQHALVNNGIMNWAVVPIDFTDKNGQGKPSEIYLSELKKIDEWLAWYSNGKLKINWVVKDEWIRAPLDSREYNWIHPGNSGYARYTPQVLGSELAKIGEKSVSYENLDAVFYLYPPSVTEITDALTFYSSISTSKVTNKRIMNTASGYWLTNPNNHQLIWAWMIHEIGHPMGLTGHSPINPGQFGIMHNQGGMGLGLNSWDSLILDWINESQVYCIDKSNIHGEELTLVPVEREQAGIRSVMIKISESKVLVVESHRPDKWSFRMPQAHYGVMAFLVDTTQNTDRRDENDEFNAKLPKTAWNITVDKVSTRWIGNLNISTTMLLGETITIEGIKLTLVKSGDNDIVRVEKVG